MNIEYTYKKATFYIIQDVYIWAFRIDLLNILPKIVLYSNDI